MKASFYVFKIISWDLQVSAVPCSIVGMLGSVVIFVPEGFRTLPVYYFAKSWPKVQE